LSGFGSINRISVALIAPDGTLNLSKLRPPPAPGREAAPTSALPAVRIDSFSIHDGRVRLEDRSPLSRCA